MLRRYLTDIVQAGACLPRVRRRAAAALAVVTLTLAGPSMAQQVEGPLAAEPKSGNVTATFKFGWSAYKRGNKNEAFRGFQDAADQGHTGSRWKLANMYAQGDGVAEDDAEAFRLFEGIVREGADPDSRKAAFVADAMVSLAGYLRQGIPGSQIVANPARARELYWQAAANFGQPHAQFELGRMFLNGEGGKADARQAARWFKLASEKGHPGAQAMLGHMLFERGKSVQGLAMMTQALGQASGRDRTWIRHLQEDAFAVASEADRRTAIALAGDLAN